MPMVNTILALLPQTQVTFFKRLKLAIKIVMNPKQYECQQAYEDFCIKDIAMDKVIKKIIAPNYQMNEKDREIIIEREKALKRLKVAKEAVDID